jgi:hypothetical protein
VELTTLSTTPFHYPLSKECIHVDKPAHYKIVHFSKPFVFNNLYTYNFLHETMHGLIEGKHFQDYGSGDKPPYNSAITCQDSVMSYRETCPPVLNREKQLFGAAPISLFDRRPEVQKKLKQVIAAYPSQLGPADLEAAQDFNRSWEKRNKHLQQREAFQNNHNPAKEKNAEFLHKHENLIRVPMEFGGFSFNLFKASAVPALDSIELKCSAKEQALAFPLSYADAKESATIDKYALYGLVKNLFFTRLPGNQNKPITEEVRKQLTIYYATILKLQESLNSAKRSEANKAGLINPETLVDYQTLLTYMKTRITSFLEKDLISSNNQTEIAERMTECHAKINALIKFIHNRVTKKQARHEIIKQARRERHRAPPMGIKFSK